VADNALRLAEAEREKRRRQAAQVPAQTAPSSPTAMQQANEFVAGVARPLAGMVDFAMSPVAAAYEAVTGEPARGVSTMITPPGAFTGKPGLASAAGEYVGMAMPVAAGLPALGSAGPRMAQGGLIQKFLDNITKTAFAAPKTYLASEALGAVGAGVAGETAREAGAGPVGQLTSEFAGSMIGGIPTMLPSGMRAAREGITASLAPMTSEGGMIRASRQMQERAGGQAAAQRAAVSFEDIPSGVSPAQWIGDERLMAQEARLLTDNPELSNQVKAELQDARIAAQESLLDSFGKPRNRQDWERSVLERVAPAGSTIAPGMTDEMLETTYQSFKPLYDSAKGFDINIPNATESMQGLLSTGRIGRTEPGLQRLLNASAFDDAVMATDESRQQVQRWLNSQYTAYRPQVQNETIKSDALIDLRSKIRDERRLQERRGNMERADLLGSAEGNITTALMRGLPEDASTVLKGADAQYRKYKVVENAIYNAGDSALTPEQLAQSIRTGGLTTSSRYARGADPVTQELRIAALGGRSTEEVIGDPRRAALFVRGLDDAGKKAVQADFVNTLYNRAKQRATDATPGGVPFISGSQLMRDIAENKNVMARLGMSQSDITRVENIAKQITKMERRSPAAVDRLFTDGPASILDLGAALMGAKSGQRLAGNGMGSALVLAQYMSNRARRTLATLTSDEAERLMSAAASDPKLYRALLTKEIVDPRRERQMAQYVESWLLASAADKAIQEQQ